MSVSINTVMLGGNLTRDPESRTTNSGNTEAKFSVAVNSKRKQADGSYSDEVGFFNVVVYGRTAGPVMDYLQKGSSVVVEGNLRFSSWEDKDTGAKRSKIDIVAHRVHFVGKVDAQNVPAGPSQGGVDTEDVPF